MPTPTRFPRSPLVTVLSLLVLAACPVNGSTEPVTTTDTTTGAISTSGAPVTSGATTSGTGSESGSGTAVETGSTGPATTTGTTTAATATDEESSAEDACNESDCEPCPEGCTPMEVCELGSWKCECVDCPGEVACDKDPPVFPEFDEACAVIEDCTIVFHQLDCCGSQAAWGVSADASKPFAEAEAMCTMQYGMCECPTLPTVADDGNSAEDPGLIQVDCVDGLCKTFVP